ncbi:MAG: phosphotransferase family protein [Caulobacteraceae bacterium]|nr:phosphotransferase family protein [Caulobacteraceae bacterium]
MVEAVTESVPGYDVPAVEAWIAANSPLTPPFKWTRLTGGHSNLTWRIDDARGRTSVVRRPPLGELLPKAHDMGREWAVISAIGQSPVPVPEAIAFCEDVSVTGARFYVMGWVEGRPLHNADDTRAFVAEEDRRSLGFSFIDVLADLHAIDPDDVGLGSLGKRDSYVRRQLSTWHKSWVASAGPAQLDDERMHRLEERLVQSLPDQGPARIVHGDYGLHNCLSRQGQVSAVLDWEISTLGDPLADLAYALNRFPDPAEGVSPESTSATSPPGFPTRAELADRYAERSGRDLSNLAYYSAFNHWKSACILQGVYARYLEGKKSHEGVDLPLMANQIAALVSAADEAASRAGV